MSEEDIRRDIANAVPYRPGDASRAAEPEVEILPGSAFPPEEMRWLWRHWLALGKLHLLAGAAGTGKTTIALSMAAALTSGQQWPDGSDQPGGDVLIWSGEDAIGDTLMPRFLASGGDPDRIHFVYAARDNGRSRPFDPASDMPRLMRAAERLTGLRLLILDPVVSVITGDSHKNAETRRGLQPVVDFANTLDCAVLGITHLAKNSSGRDPLERIAGSLAFGAVPRGAMVTVKPADPNRPRRLLRTKTTNGRDDGGIEYTLLQAPVPGRAFTAQRVDWGQPLDGTARELMAVETPGDHGPSAVGEAETFLREALKDGPMATKDVKAAAEAHGHTWRSVERAKKALGVEAIKLDFRTGWSWRLPAKTANTDEDRHRTDLWRPSEEDR